VINLMLAFNVPFRTKLIAVYLALCAGLVFSVVTLWEWLWDCLVRIPPPWQFGCALGDGLAFWWFSRYTVHLVKRADEPEDLPTEAARSRRMVNALLWSFWFAFFIDLGSTAWALYEEWHIRQTSAVPAMGEAYQVESKPRLGEDMEPGWSKFEGRYRFRDASGVVSQGKFTLDLHRDGRQLPFEKFSPEEVACIHQRRVPFPIRVVYDPDLPARNWAEGEFVRIPNPNVLHTFSAGCLSLQLFVLCVVSLELRSQLKKGVVPWWHEMCQAIPLLIQIGSLTVVACIVQLTRWMNPYR
jgi:hypothetical protein